MDAEYSTSFSREVNNFNDSESDDVLQEEDVWVVVDENVVEEPSATKETEKVAPVSPKVKPSPAPPSTNASSIELPPIPTNDVVIDINGEDLEEGFQYGTCSDNHGVYIACREVAFPSTTTTVLSHVSTIHYPGTVTMVLGEGSHAYLRLLSGALHNEPSYQGVITYNTNKLDDNREHILALISYYSTDYASYLGTVDDFLKHHSKYVADQVIPFHPNLSRNPGKVPSPYQPFPFRFNYQYLLSIFHFPNQKHHLESLLATKMSHLTDEEQYIVHCIHLLLSPKLILLIDSPPSTISHSNLEILSSLFQSWACRTNGVVIFAVHNTAAISHVTLTYINHTLLFHKGSVVYQGPPVDLLPYSIAIGFPPPRDGDVVEFIQSYLTNPKAIQEQLSQEDRDRAIRVLEKKVGFAVLPKDQDSVRREETEAIIDKEDELTDDDLVSVSRFAYSQNIGVRSVRSGFVIITKIIEEEKQEEQAQIDHLNEIADSAIRANQNPNSPSSSNAKQREGKGDPDQTSLNTTTHGAGQRSAFRSQANVNSTRVLQSLKVNEDNVIPTLSTYGILSQCVSTCETKDMLLGYYRSSPFFKAILPDIELLTNGQCEIPSFFTIPIMKQIDPSVVATAIVRSEQHEQQQLMLTQPLDEGDEEGNGDGDDENDTASAGKSNNRPQDEQQRQGEQGELTREESDFYSCVEYRESILPLSEDKDGFIVVPSNLEDKMNGRADDDDNDDDDDDDDDTNNADGQKKAKTGESITQTTTKPPQPPQYTVLPPQIMGVFFPSFGFFLKTSFTEAMSMLFTSSPVHFGTVVFQVWFAILLLIFSNTIHADTLPDDVYGRLSLVFLTIALTVTSTLFLLPTYYEQHRHLHFTIFQQGSKTHRNRFTSLFAYMLSELSLHILLSFIMTVPYWLNTSHTGYGEYAKHCLFIVLIVLRTIYIATGLNRLISLLSFFDISNITIFGCASLVHGVFIAMTPHLIPDAYLPRAVKFTRYLSPYNWSYYALAQREFSSPPLSGVTLPFQLDEFESTIGSDWNVISIVGTIILVIVFYSLYLLMIGCARYKYRPNPLIIDRRIFSMSSHTIPLHKTNQSFKPPPNPTIPLLEMDTLDVAPVIPLHQLNITTSLVQSHLTLKEVTVTFKQTDILSNLNMYIEPGKVTLFTGPTGTYPDALIELLLQSGHFNGKSFHMSGELLVNGQPYHQLPSNAVGLVEASITFPKHYTVHEIVTLYTELFLHPLTTSAYVREKMLYEITDICQSSHLLHLRLGSLLPSEVIQVSLMLALIQGPSIVLVRDPFVTIRDAPFMPAFLKILRNVALSGRTVLVTSSIPLPSNTFYECDRVGIIVRGGHQMTFCDVGYRGRLFTRQIVKYPGLSAMLYSNPLAFLFSTLDTALARHILWVQRPQDHKYLLDTYGSTGRRRKSAVTSPTVVPTPATAAAGSPQPQRPQRKRRRQSLNQSNSSLSDFRNSLTANRSATDLAGHLPQGYDPFNHMFQTDSLLDKEHQSRTTMDEFINNILNYYYTSVLFDRTMNLVERGKQAHREQQENVKKSEHYNDVDVPSLPLPRVLKQRLFTWILLFKHELTTFGLSHYLPLPLFPAIFSILSFAMYYTYSTHIYDTYDSSIGYLASQTVIATLITPFQFDHLLLIPLLLSILTVGYYALSYHLYARLYYAYLYRHRHVPLYLVMTSITFTHILMSLLSTIFTVFPFYFLMNFTIAAGLFLRFFFSVFLATLTMAQFTLCLSLLFRNPLMIRLIQVASIVTSLLFSAVFQNASQIYIGLQYISLLLPIPRCLDALRALSYSSLVTSTHSTIHHLMTDDSLVAYWADIIITIAWIILFTILLVLAAPRLISRLYHHHRILDNAKVKRIRW